MTVRKDTLFERFIAPVFGTFFIDREALLRYRNSIDWEAEGDRLRRSEVVYPDYYSQQNFHGVKNGYLSVDAAVTYDPVTKYALPPHEEWVRQSLVDRVRVVPRRILDLGCGTGSTTVLLKKAFPEAEVIGLDLSPYMLVAADHKARDAQLDIQFLHGNAEQTGLAENSFDLVTASLLFHETPPQVARNVLFECLRLLRAGGEVMVLDGNQATLRQTPWLMDIFEEPYIRDYADGSVDAWMGAVGFGAVRTDTVWGMHQVTRGIKPLSGREPQRVEFKQWETMGGEQFAIAPPA